MLRLAKSAGLVSTIRRGSPLANIRSLQRNRSFDATARSSGQVEVIQDQPDKAKNEKSTNNEEACLSSSRMLMAISGGIFTFWVLKSESSEANCSDLIHEKEKFPEDVKPVQSEIKATGQPEETGEGQAEVHKLKVKSEGQSEVKAEGQSEVKAEGQSEVKAEVQSKLKAEGTSEIKPDEVKPEVEPKVEAEVKVEEKTTQTQEIPAWLVEKRRRSTAFHEAGHAVCAWFLPCMARVKEVSIKPDAKRRGYTSYENDASFPNEEGTFQRLCVDIAGMAAEEMFLNAVSPLTYSSDLKHAVHMAMKGILCLSVHMNLSLPSRNQSNGSAGEKQLKELELQLILIELCKAYGRTRDLLREHEEGVRKIANLLLERETLSAQDVEQVLGKRPQAHFSLKVFS